jgi:hypothetical protein
VHPASHEHLLTREPRSVFAGVAAFTIDTDPARPAAHDITTGYDDDDSLDSTAHVFGRCSLPLLFFPAGLRPLVPLRV